MYKLLIALLCVGILGWNVESYDNVRPVPAGESISVSAAVPDSIVDLARTLQGIPYRMGGNSIQSGFDCSGFVSYVFRQFGILVGRSSRDQALVGYEVSITEARPGDIVVFSRSAISSVFHAGLIESNGEDGLVMIHSNQSNGVHRTSILESSYWKPKLKSIRRVMN